MAIQQAKETQSREGLVDPPARMTGPKATPVSLQTDLLSAREEIKQLRDDLKRLRTRLSSKLGQEVEGVSAAELLERVQEVEEANRRLTQDLAERESRAVKLAERVQELEEENEAKTHQLRSMIFAQNT
ncbi:hypothetical protein [Microbacterium sp.]|uniref:hypothetical protein n=1 Tax=Microbacterium sp. TaxID=51671 RepID=UPI00289FE15E|nr:hypothetical protein [Microbacterium sp.]